MPPRRAPIRIFPSTLVTNTHRAEGIFKLMAREAQEKQQLQLQQQQQQQQDGGDVWARAAGFKGPSGAQQLRGPSPAPSSGSTAVRALTVSTRRTAATASISVSSRRGATAAAPAAQQQQEQPHQPEAARQQPEQPQADRRRSSRCSGEKIDDWIRIPVEASVLVSSGTWELLEGVVFLSPQTGQLWKRNDLAIFEATYKGACYNYLVPEGQLPMMTVDHPEFKAQVAKIEEARRRKLGRISEMIRCSKANFEAEHGWEVHAIEAAHAAELQGAREELRRGLDHQHQSASAAAASSSAANAPGVSDAATSPPPAPEEAPAAPAPAAASAAGVVLEAIGATAAGGRKLALDNVLAELKEHPLMRARRKRARAEQGPTGAGSLGPSFRSSGSGSGSGSGASLGMVGRLASDPSLSSAGGSALSRSGASAMGLDEAGAGEEEGEEEGSEAEFLGSDDTDDPDEDAEASGYRDIVEIFQERLLQSERPKPAPRKKRRRKWGRGRPWTR